MSQDRKVMKKSDLLLVGLLALVCAGLYGFYYWRSHSGPKENYAVLQVRNQVVATYDLSEHHAHEIIDLQPLYGFPGKIEFQDGAVRFIEVTCPDKICEAAGYLQGEYEMAACLPNQAALIIYTPEEYRNLTK